MYKIFANLLHRWKHVTATSTRVHNDTGLNVGYVTAASSRASHAMSSYVHHNAFNTAIAIIVETICPYLYLHPVHAITNLHIADVFSRLFSYTEGVSLLWAAIMMQV